VSERESQLVLGVDPDPSALWPGLAHARADGPDARADGHNAHGDGHEAGADGHDAREAAAGAVLVHCRALIDATAAECVAVKLQLARFEVLGAAGWSVLEQVAEHARGLGLLVIADAKRGDIDVSAEAYASALLDGRDSPFGRLAGLRADLVTVNPLMGADAVEPFVHAARRAGAGILVLVRTSNRGAADFEDLELAGSSERVWERVAAMVDELGRAGVGRCGLSDVGAVVGATQPGHLARARELMGAATFLLPGIGAQGGRVEDLAAAFAPGPAGGLVSASRSIVGAYRTAGGEPASAARAEARRLRQAAWELSPLR
jgi:orotidine-5'-phosphate decarboxylase